MRQGSQSLRWLPALTTTVIVGVFGAIMPAQGECLSPSAEAGATATTVYRCPEGDAAGTQSPILVDPEKTTEVERGSADLPWFEPKPAKTGDPIETMKAPLGNEEKKEDLVKISPPPAEVAKPEAADTPLAAAPKAKTAKPKPAMAKPAKVKLAKAKRTKSKLARKKQAKTKTAKAQASQQPVKTEPAKADEKVIVWTKKDMPIGSRIKNWFGF
jgi:outer membrane biosynthesis protein TonB